jgi:hypothetical protein
MDPRQSSYEPFRHTATQDNYEADRQMAPSGDEETLLKREDYAHPQHALDVPRGRGGVVGHDHHAPPHRRFQAIRTVFRVLSLVLAITVVGIQAYSSYVWLKTRHDATRNRVTGFQTKIWAFIDPWPTWVMLGAGVAAVVVHFIAFGSFCGCVCTPTLPPAVTLLPEARLQVQGNPELILGHQQCQSARKGAIHVWAVYLSSILMLAAWIAAAVYFKIVDSAGAKKKNWDLWSWTCRKRAEKDGDVAWNALCVENVSRIHSLVSPLMGQDKSRCDLTENIF